MNKVNLNPEWEVLISEMSKNSTSIAYGIFTSAGELISANKTMCHYLDTNSAELKPKNSFINPNFEKISSYESQ